MKPRDRSEVVASIQGTTISHVKVLSLPLYSAEAEGRPQQADPARKRSDITSRSHRWRFGCLVTEALYVTGSRTALEFRSAPQETEAAASKMRSGSISYPLIVSGSRV